MENYTDTTKIGQFLQRTLSANETSALSGFILAAIDAWIDRQLQSHFGSVGETTREYDGGWHTVDIDPCQSITAVKILNNDGTDGSTYTDLTDYVAEPANDDIKRELVHRGRGRFPRGQQRIAVTAKFSEYDFTNNTVPSDIVLAATRLAGGILAGGKSQGSGGTVASESLEGHSISYDTNSDAIDAIAAADPIIMGCMSARREIYIYDDRE